jgi:hypothetical protein
MASIPMFILGQGHTQLPPLTVEQAKAIAQIILCDEAKRTRTAPRGSRPKSPIAGMFVSYSGKCRWQRGSDRVERIYAAVELLKHSGLTNKQAASEVAELLGTRIGNSKRGRPARGAVIHDLVRRAQIVRSLSNRFKQRHPWKEALPEHDPVAEKWFGYAVQLAAWSAQVSDVDDAFFNKPADAAFHSLVRVISACAKQLQGLYADYPSRRDSAGTASMLVTAAHSAPSLPNGWRPSGYLSVKAD